MHPFVRAAAAALPLLAALACGGRTDGIPGTNGCPAPSAVVDGASCSTSGLVCPTTGATCDGAQATCTCSGGRFGCGDFPVTCTNACPVSATPGSSCDPATQGGCTFAVTVPLCGGGSYTASCSCQPQGASGAGTWDCGAAPEPDCPDAQPGCPPPSTIQLGGTCSVGANVSCQSAIPVYGCSGQVEGYVSCFCDAGGWNCAEPGAPDCACPDPSGVQQGLSCTVEGQQCPGRPSVCGGQVLYDAFQCTNGTWDDIATTICDVDASGGGGPIDAGAFDAGGG